MNIPCDLHRFIIGQKGREVRQMMEQYDVNISIPPSAQQSDIVKITGPRRNVEEAEEGMKDKLRELENQEEDRVGVEDRVRGWGTG